MLAFWTMPRMIAAIAAPATLPMPPMIVAATANSMRSTAGLRQDLRARAVKKHAEPDERAGDQHGDEEDLPLVDAVEFGEIRIVGDRRS